MSETASINYEVPGMDLVVQDQTMACWYASAHMVLKWRDKNRLGGLLTTRDDDATIQLYRANKGIQNAQILALAKRFGLKAVPPMSPSPDALYRWLQVYGPLWTNGLKHITVIAGIRGPVAGGGYEVKVYDPWPGNGVTWRSLGGWYTGMGGDRNAGSRDAGADVEAVFLHA